MEKKDYCLNFVETIKEKNKEGLYKFFTKKSVIVFLKDFKEIIVPDFVDYIENNYFNKEIIIKRVLESKVCTKIETSINNEIQSASDTVATLTTNTNTAINSANTAAATANAAADRANDAVEAIQAIISEQKPNQREKIVLHGERVRQLIPKNLPFSQREEYICKALEHYAAYVRRRAERETR